MQELKPYNPFLVGRYISPKYFCDREIELDNLVKNVMNGRDVLISSRRRLGKSGLIFRLFDDERIKNNYELFYLDIFHTQTFAEFVYELSRIVINNIGKRRTLFERFVQIVKSLKLDFSIDPLTAEPSIGLSLGSITNPELTLDEIFAYFDTTDKHCLVVIDEFQEISFYSERGIEALLRSKIQRCKQATFIFSGSKQHILLQMVQSANRPFYHSTINTSLGLIDLDKYIRFVAHFFKESDKHIEEEVIRLVYQRFEGITWYIQYMFNELFALTAPKAICGKDMIPLAIDNIVNQQASHFEAILKEMPLRQKELLYAIVRNKNTDKIKSADFIIANHLRSSSSVQSAERALIDNGTIIKDNGFYRIEDYFFEVYLRR